MNSQTLARKSQVTKPANIKNRISQLLESLGNKVRNFTVIDKQGQVLGEVKELVLDDENRLNLVISRRDKLSSNYKLLQLRSQKIQKIDHPTQSIFVDLEKSEIGNMPENLEPKQPDREIISEKSSEQIDNSPIINGKINIENVAKVGEEEVIRLLEERLVVNSNQRKIGDVIVRKEIETRMVQVPVRREKLIVEQVSPDHKQLAEIHLGEDEISSIELTGDEIPEVASLANGLTVSGLFTSPKIASLLLNAIALEKENGCQQIQVTVVVDNEEYRQKYQEWFDRCSVGKEPNA